jgi:peptidoglycan/LPS O-acetylase OafA/YrhL
MATAQPATAAAQAMPPGKLYFPGLNGLRAVAASLVVLGHYDQVAKRYGLPTMVPNEEITLGLSINAVGIFFVLSGFLLTYLLMAEKAKHGRIALGKFYMRRILRIWPLYYIILLIGFGLFPLLEFAHAPGYVIGLEQDGIGTLLLYIFMLPHVVFAYINNEIVVVSVLWSIGVEETFYLFWPILLALFRRHLLPILGVLVFFALLIPVGGYILFHF